MIIFFRRSISQSACCCWMMLDYQMSVDVTVSCGHQIRSTFPVAAGNELIQAAGFGPEQISHTQAAMTGHIYSKRKPAEDEERVIMREPDAR